RIRLFPSPGYATEADLIRINETEDRLYELEDGLLVEKPMGWYESLLATLISSQLAAFVSSQNLGKVFGPDGPFQLLSGVVKLPDVSFVSWESWPKEPQDRAWSLPIAPDLAIEVLSKSNTKREM